MATSVGTTIQLRRDTTANWTEANPVLALAEPGLDTDKNLIKYGDGVLTWANLPYAGSGPDIGGNLNPTANGVFTLGNVTNRWQSLYATGNITGNYFIGNGSQLTGLPASYSNTNVATYLASGTDTANIITTANISGSYILGNGALLTGVITSVANINNGTSNVTVVSSDGNITVGVGGTSNVAVFAATGEYVTGVVSASGNITGGNIVTAAAVSAASVSASANITGGNITANYFSGNGALLTGVGSVTSVATGTGLTGGPITTTGTIAIDSTVATLSGTQTLSNKRIDPRDVTTTTATSLTPDVAVGDIYCYTALASALTINAPTGTPTNGDKLIFRLLDNGTARALTWDATYTAIGVTLPTTTVINKTTYVGCIYNSNNTRWDVVAVTTQA